MYHKGGSFQGVLKLLDAFLFLLQLTTRVRQLSLITSYKEIFKIVHTHLGLVYTIEILVVLTPYMYVLRLMDAHIKFCT